MMPRSPCMSSESECAGMNSRCDSAHLAWLHNHHRWARGHMSSQRLITAFKKQKGGRSGFMLKPLDPGCGVSAATIARRNRLQHSKIAKVASQTLVDKLSRTTKFDANELRRLRHVRGAVSPPAGWHCFTPHLTTPAGV